MSTVNLVAHANSGSYNDGAYSVLVVRNDEYRFGTRQYDYYALVTRKSDGKTVRVTLQTFRTNLHFGSRSFSGYKFNDWLALNGSVTAPASAKVVSQKKTDIVDIDTDYKKTATVTINIQKTFTGDADDVRDELYDLISQLEEAIRDIED